MFGVQFSLTKQAVSQQSAFPVIEANGGFIAGGFNAEGGERRQIQPEGFLIANLLRKGAVISDVNCSTIRRFRFSASTSLALLWCYRAITNRSGRRLEDQAGYLLHRILIQFYTGNF